jgi:uncharacterized membrane protein YgcG
MKKILISLLFVCLVLFPFGCVLAASGNTVQEDALLLQVQENGSVHIEHHMRIAFNSSAPLVLHLHNSFAMQTAENKDLHFDAPAKNITVEGLDYSIDQKTSGLTDISLSGNKDVRDVTVAFDIAPVAESLDTMDFLYNDILWGDQDYVIQNLSAKILLPKAFDPEALNVIYGDASGQTEKTATIAVDGQNISIQAENKQPGDWLTIALKLPQGYFGPAATSAETANTKTSAPVITSQSEPAFERIGADFDIESYTVYAQVSEQNTIHIREDIRVRHYTPQHGFYRDIPTFYSMRWQGASQKTNYRIPVENIRAEGLPFKTETYNDYARIKIGDENKTVEGLQNYSLSYDLPIGDDMLPSKDFVYLNLIGTQWQAAVNQAAFEITLPKNFDQKNVRFYTGMQGYQKSDASFTVQGRTIRAKTTRQLKNLEGVTFEVTLPEGYFTPPIRTDPFVYIDVSSVLLLLAGLMLFLIFGKSRRVVKTLEFTPPEGLSPAQASYVLQGFVGGKDILALLLNWAAQGLISLSGGKKHFAIEKKAKSIQFEDAAQANLFQGLFSASDIVTEKSSVNLYGLFEAAKWQVEQSFEASPGHRLFLSGQKKWKLLFKMLSTLPIAAFFCLVVYQNGTPLWGGILAGLVQGIVFYFAAMSLERTYLLWRSLTFGRKLTRIIILALFVLWYIACVLVIGGSPVHFAAVLIIALLLAATGMHMKKRTPKGNALLGKLLGFKEFIRTAEKDRIERLAAQDPQLFFKILPYAYALNITDAWIKRFEGIAVSPVQGYVYDKPNNVFETIAFYQSIQATLDSMQAASVHRTDENSGSGYDSGSYGGDSGSGGSAGGGFGGGGGGTW